MAAGLNTAQIIQTAKAKGITLTDAQAQPILSQAWDQSIFGADPSKVDSILSSYSSGGTTSSTPGISANPASAPPVVPSYSDIFASASALTAPQTQAAVNTLQSGEAAVTQGAKDTAAAYTAEVPTINNIYSDLASTLLTQFQTNTAVTSGSMKTAAAASGIDTTTGFEAASERQAVKVVADQYNVNADELVQENSKDVQTVQAEAAAALQSGNTELANINSEIATVQMDGAKMTTDAASAILSADTTEEAQYYTNLYNNAQIDIQKQTLALDAQKLAITKYTPVTTYDANGNPQVVAFNTQTGQVVGNVAGGNATAGKPVKGGVQSQAAIDTATAAILNGTATMANYANWSAADKENLQAEVAQYQSSGATP